jgi:membrane-bound metal-dependent hydrolase YbcI (DUF457 family)
MAAFREHITFSCALGAGYSVLLAKGLGEEWPLALQAGALCGVSGMLPDLDSDSGTPVREIFGVTAAVLPLLFLHKLHRMGMSPEATLLVFIAAYLLIRFVLAWLFRLVTVHRGMFHSIPGALIAAELAYLAYDPPHEKGRLLVAFGVFLGFLSHLVLDEIYSVDINSVLPRLKTSAGSALKFASKSVIATVFTWLLLGVLTYLVGVQQGYWEPVPLAIVGGP